MAEPSEPKMMKAEEANSAKSSSAESSASIPPTNSAEDPFASHEFKLPCTQVKSVMDMARWSKSQAHSDFMGFIMLLNSAVKGKKLSSECAVSETTKSLVKLLDTLDTWIDEAPPVEQPQRFGNKAFRTWFERLQNEKEKLVSDILPENLKRAGVEVAEYLVDSFGNSTRIDYGTGHEASFACFLCCLFKLRVLDPNDQVATVTHTFKRYLEVARKLQTMYRMEPAGSQGVWGLDDFQFLPFIWGSSQFFSHPTILPVHFVDPKVVEANRSEYMFLECIQYIMSVKTGPFAEHSNTLWGISGVAHWGKVNSGLIKMYKAEILQKFPIIQHFKFGSILVLEPADVKPILKI